MVEVRGISYSYGKRQVLRQVSLHAEKGECVAVAGPNGCGKSTLLSLLAGALRLQEGEIRYGGQDPRKDPRIFRRMLGYVPQDNPLLEDLSVRDNLRLWYSGSPYSMAEDLRHGLLSALKLEEMLPRTVSKLSGGMKKRVSIGCALASHPQILILDEPSTALDLICKEEIRGYLRLFLEEGGTVLLTTHEEAELDLCSRLYILKEGKLREADPGLRGDRLAEAMLPETEARQGGRPDPAQ